VVRKQQLIRGNNQNDLKTFGAFSREIVVIFMLEETASLEFLTLESLKGCYIK
jgi:hypothetical protein